MQVTVNKHECYSLARKIDHKTGVAVHLDELAGCQLKPIKPFKPFF